MDIRKICDFFQSFSDIRKNSTFLLLQQAPAQTPQPDTNDGCFMFPVNMTQLGPLTTEHALILE